MPAEFARIPEFYTLVGHSTSVELIFGGINGAWDGLVFARVGRDLGLFLLLAGKVEVSEIDVAAGKNALGGVDFAFLTSVVNWQVTVSPTGGKDLNRD